MEKLTSNATSIIFAYFSQFSLKVCLAIVFPDFYQLTLPYVQSLFPCLIIPIFDDDKV